MTAVTKVTLNDIQPLRALYLQETNFQIRYNACHERGMTDSYLLTVDGASVGYGSIKGQEIPERNTVFEYFVIPPFRKHSGRLFRELLQVSGASFIECQTNDPFLSSLLFEFGSEIRADVFLFEDHAVTERVLPGAVVRRSRPDDQVFEHRDEPVGDFVLEMGGEVVGTAGFLLHYNRPFADLYMEIREDCRRRGYASYLLQEVKKECYLAGRVPAARCGLHNLGSRRSLINAGLRVCGFVAIGRTRSEQPHVP